MLSHSISRPVAFLCAALLSAWAWAAPATTRGAATTRLASTLAVEQAIRDLGSEDFVTRERASQRLWDMGPTAEAALRLASRSGDPEVAARAGELLRKLALGITPQTPPHIARLLGQFDQAADDARKAIAGQLAGAGREGIVALARLWRAGTRDDARQVLREAMLGDAAGAASALVALGDPAGADELLSAGASRGDLRAALSLAALELLRGGLGRRIADLADDNTAQGHRLRAAFHRAGGDLKAAIESARRSGDWATLEALLPEGREYAQLAASIEARAPQRPGLEAADFAESSRLLLLYQLAGDVRKSGEWLDVVRRRARLSPDDAMECARAMLACGRVEEAVGAMLAANRFAPACELYVQRLMFDDAAKVVAKAAQEGAEDADLADARLQQALHRLGDRERAAARLGELARRARDPATCEAVVRAEAELGLRQAALDHVADFLGDQERQRRARALLEAAFGRGSSAAAWYAALRGANADEPRRKTLARVDDLLSGRVKGAALTELVDQAAGVMATWEQTAAASMEQAAGTLMALGAGEEARKLLERAAGATPSSGVFTLLGHMAVDRADLAGALDAYERAMRCDPTDAVATWFAGWAMAAAGDEAAGKARMRLAELLPLADEESRGRLIESMNKRGHPDAAASQGQLLLRTGAPWGLDLHNELERASHRLGERGDYLAAADLLERGLVGCVGTSVHYAQITSYLSVPAMIHRLRARGLAARGAFEGALSQAERCLALLPGDIDVVVELVPELDKRGRKPDADRLFARVWAVYEPLVKAHPQSSQQHNNIAWLAGRIGRRLDEALAHARRAVELEPDSAACIDTLAEVHYQMGRRDEAIKLIRQAIVISPSNDYLREQLKRFEEPRR